MHAHCPTCGHAMPREITIDYATADVTYEGVSVHLSPTKCELLEILISVGKRGIRKDALWDKLYQLRPEAEIPDLKIIDVFICGIRKAFAKKGLAIDFQTDFRGTLSLVYGKVPAKAGERHLGVPREMAGA